MFVIDADEQLTPEAALDQKELFYRLPARPLIKFVLLYGLKRGFLDGRPGFSYALLQSIYEAFIVLKVQELDLELASTPSSAP